MDEIALVTTSALPLMFLIGGVAAIMIRSQQTTINRQQETIQRLVSREPVTYVETGQKPPNPVRESFAAWGNEMINAEELV